MIDGWGISCEIALMWMSVDFTDAWRHQTITWPNVDPDLGPHMASLGHNMLNGSFVETNSRAYYATHLMWQRV